MEQRPSKNSPLLLILKREDKARIRAAAAREGLGMGPWIRRLALVAARTAGQTNPEEFTPAAQG